MKTTSCLIVTVFAVAGLTALIKGSASANQYPVINPKGLLSYATLQPGSDFIQYVPEQSPGMPDPNPVIGDNIGQPPPGAFGVGGPLLGKYFIGVFSRPLEIYNPEAALYLWATFNSGPSPNPPPPIPQPEGPGPDGPNISLGHWNGTTFTQYGITVTSVWYNTGIAANPPYDTSFEIASSITPLSDFSGGSIPVFPDANAVRIEPSGHFFDRVNAVGTPTPEPGIVALVGSLGLTCAAFLRRRKGNKAA